MKKVSHSEITTYLDCQKKWDLIYNKGMKIDGVHLRFGVMAHKVLETGIIPDESLYPDLKETFGVSSWNDYFTAILTELNDSMKHYTKIGTEVKIETNEIKGIIDAVWYDKGSDRYLLTDYKFSTGKKDAEDLLLDEQLYIYALAYCSTENIPLNKIDIGYISIPKTEMDKPRVLKNGQLSKDKAQNVTYKTYLEYIKEHNLNMDDYADFLEEIKDKTLLKIAITSINEKMLLRIVENIDNVIKDMQKGYVLEKCTYMCKNCDFVQQCKHKM